MKKLVVYYSSTENNAKIADYLHGQYKWDVTRVESARKRNGLSIFLDMLFSRKVKIKPLNRRLSDYDHVIFLAPIWVGKVATPLKTLLVDEKHNIRSYSFITVCGGGDQDQMQKVTRELASLVGKEPVNVLQLKVSDLQEAEKKDGVKYVSEIRIETGGVIFFSRQIQEFVNNERLMLSDAHAEPEIHVDK